MDEQYTIPELRGIRIRVGFTEPWGNELSGAISHAANIIAVRRLRKDSPEQMFFELESPVCEGAWVYHCFAASPRFKGGTFTALLEPMGALTTNHWPVSREMMLARRWFERCDEYGQPSPFFYGEIARM